jgi:hypothetical protein
MNTTQLVATRTLIYNGLNLNPEIYISSHLKYESRNVTPNLYVFTV